MAAPILFTPEVLWPTVETRNYVGNRLPQTLHQNSCCQRGLTSPSLSIPSKHGSMLPGPETSRSSLRGQISDTDICHHILGRPPRSECRQVANTCNHNRIHLWPAAPFLGTHFQIAASGVGTGANPAVDNTSTLELAWVSDKSHSLPHCIASVVIKNQAFLRVPTRYAVETQQRGSKARAVLGHVDTQAHASPLRGRRDPPGLQSVRPAEGLSVTGEFRGLWNETI